MDRWLRSVAPALSFRQMTMGTLGFQMGGYLAIALGGAFLVLGSSLPRTFYLYWAAATLLFGSVSLYYFRSFHASQLVLLPSIVLGLFYLTSRGPV
ncbi:hypothetical protein U7230_07130 [Carboxydochorda subterranea]|uniref:DUF4401 domain-containing protein n=1 Tax=Carboxydichorda subterranea TaxID=3109565 RepID=A0ABZ1C3R7_9FIRM|nr:hypothetical protein [Limnochorda sp. L945t]WRP18757.1 hypothetical protein U7230_07130 [Limnochorda sp. L945t]